MSGCERVNGTWLRPIAARWPSGGPSGCCGALDGCLRGTAGISRTDIAAREEERRRLRRELHDGLGPTLTGIAFAADAAANPIDTDPGVERLLTSLRRDSRTALADVRRIVDDLRPPALDELGLVGALRQRADQFSWRADGASVHVQLDVPDEVPALPAAIEVATYRIATEALTNVVRHSRATGAVVRLRCDERLDLSITDDGPPNGAWAPGVGLHAMRERAAELGGSFRAGPSPTGWPGAGFLPACHERYPRRARR